MHYFLRDAEHLEAGEGNVLLRNSELAVTGWIAWNRLFASHSEQALIDHYRRVYDPNAVGFKEMTQSLVRLADYAKQRHIALYLAMVPDVHKLTDYPFLTIHEQVKKIATDDGYRFVDTLPAFAGLRPEQVWAMPGDPHPNALGHKLMAEAIFPVLDAR